MTALPGKPAAAAPCAAAATIWIRLPCHAVRWEVWQRRGRWFREVLHTWSILRGRNEVVALSAVAQSLRDKSGNLHLLDVGPHQGQCFSLASRHHHSLPDRREVARKHFQAGMLAGRGLQRLPDACRGVEPLFEKELDGRSRGGPAHQFGVLQGPAQEKVVSRALSDGDAYTRRVQLLDGTVGAVFADQIRALDEDVGRSKGNIFRPFRVDGQEGNVPDIVAGGVNHLARGFEGNNFQFNTKPPGQLGGQRDGNTARLTVGATLRKHRVPVIDGGPQFARALQGIAERIVVYAHSGISSSVISMEAAAARRCAMSSRCSFRRASKA